MQRIFPRVNNITTRLCVSLSLCAEPSKRNNARIQFSRRKKQLRNDRIRRHYFRQDYFCLVSRISALTNSLLPVRGWIFSFQGRVIRLTSEMWHAHVCAVKPLCMRCNDTRLKYETHRVCAVERYYTYAR